MHKFGLTIALLFGTFGFPASAQIVQPKDNFDFVLNGLFDLCPKLISNEIGIDFDPLPYGMVLSERRNSMWESNFRDGFAFLVLDQENRQCTMNYAGPERAMNMIAQAMQDVMSENDFKRLDVENPTSHPGSVHVRFNEDMSRRDEFITVLGPDLLTISYTEKANF